MALTKFRFESISREGKKLSGFLFSESKEAARAKLTSDGHAILALEPYIESHVINANVQKFEFKALNARNQEVRGEIEATGAYEAYRKLRVEYEFQPLYLVPSALPFEEREAWKKRGVDPDLERLFLEDKKLQAEQKKKEKVEEKKDQIEMMLDARRKEMIFLQGQIEQVIRQVQELLQKNLEYLDSSKRRDIQDRLDRLARLRQSSSVNHLEKIMEQLFEDLASDSIFAPVQGQFPDFEERRNQFRQLAKTLRGGLKKGLASVQITEKDIETLRSLLKLQPLYQVFFTLYCVFAFLCFMLLSFWALSLTKLFFGFEVLWTRFYLNSSLLWFMTGFSLIVTATASFEIFSKIPMSRQKKLMVYGSAFAVLLIFVLEFPALFPWTA